MKYSSTSFATVFIIATFISAVIAVIVTLASRSKLTVSVVIYIGIGAAVLILVAFVSWVRSEVRRRSLEARISGEVIPEAEITESGQVAGDLRRLDTEDLRLKEYKTKRDEAEKELRPYLPANARGAKRLINHQRLYGQIGEYRHIFGGEPELTYRHLAKWVLIIEHWPRLGAALTREPDKIVALENCTDVKNLQEKLNPIDTNIRASDELLAVLSQAIPLSPILGRLVRFEPSATSVQATTPHAPEPSALAADPTEQSAAL
jgi:hypothetical protein